MSRSGYGDELDNWSHVRWRGAVNAATQGKRGQTFLKDLLDALDAMPEKRLIANELESAGEFCTIGVLGQKRGIDMDDIDPEDPDRVSAAFDIASALAQEIVFMNDEYCNREETPEQRWIRMRNWVAKQIAH